jgi:hypothetical protein
LFAKIPKSRIIGNDRVQIDAEKVAERNAVNDEERRLFVSTAD